MPAMPNMNELQSNVTPHLTLSGEAQQEPSHTEPASQQEPADEHSFSMRDSIVLSDNDSVEVVHRATQVSIRNTGSSGSRSPSKISIKRLSNVSELSHDGGNSDKRSTSPSLESQSTTTPQPPPFLVLPSQQKKHRLADEDSISHSAHSSRRSSISEAVPTPSSTVASTTHDVPGWGVDKVHDLPSAPAPELQQHAPREIDTTEIQATSFNTEPETAHETLTTPAATTPEVQEQKPAAPDATVPFTASQFDDYMQDITKRAQQLSGLSGSSETPTDHLSTKLPSTEQPSLDTEGFQETGFGAHETSKTLPTLNLPSAHTGEEYSTPTAAEKSGDNMEYEEHAPEEEQTYDNTPYSSPQKEGRRQVSHVRDASFESEDSQDIFDYYQDSTNEDEDLFAAEHDLTEGAPQQEVLSPISEGGASENPLSWTSADQGTNRMSSASTVVKDNLSESLPASEITSPVLSHTSDRNSAAIPTITTSAAPDSFETGRYDGVTAPLAKSPRLSHETTSASEFGNSLEAKYGSPTAPLKSPKVPSGSFGAPLAPVTSYDSLSNTREATADTGDFSSSPTKSENKNSRFGHWKPLVDPTHEASVTKPTPAEPKIEVTTAPAATGSDSPSALTPTTQQHNLENDIMKSFQTSRSVSASVPKETPAPLKLTHETEDRAEDTLPSTPAVPDPEIAALYQNTTHFLNRPISTIEDSKTASPGKASQTNDDDDEEEGDLHKTSSRNSWDSDSDDGLTESERREKEQQYEMDLEESERREREQQREMDLENDESQQITMPKNPARTPLVEDDSSSFTTNKSNKNAHKSMILSDDDVDGSDQSDVGSLSGSKKEKNDKYDHLERHGTTATTIVTPLQPLAPSYTNSFASQSMKPDANRAPTFDFRAILTKPRSEDRRAAFDDARRREAEYEGGLDTWLAAISSTTGATGIITQPSKATHHNAPTRRASTSFSKATTFTQNIPSALKPTALKHGLTGKINVGRVSEKSSSVAKGLFARGKKFIKSDK